MNERFSDDQAREIKINLLAGVGISTLARKWRTSAETISKMKRGLTYRHVEVPGEERLRPAIATVEISAKVLETVSMTSDVEIEASLPEILAAQEKGRQERAARETAVATKEEAQSICDSMSFFGRNPPANLKKQWEALPEEWKNL